MLTVITVTKNNCIGLERTLSSLSSLNVKPYEVIIQDCLSNDDTNSIILKYSKGLNIRYFVCGDEGIYDGMNKAKRVAKGTLLHYLNAGDFVRGEPYKDLDRPVKFSVQLLDGSLRVLCQVTPKLLGTSFCHQGIVFPTDHPEYNTNYSISSDYEVIQKSFPMGLNKLPTHNHGEVCFIADGISSTHKVKRDKELFKIVLKIRRIMDFPILIILMCKVAINFLIEQFRK